MEHQLYGKNRIKAIIYDYDDTLVFTYEIKARNLQEAARKNGVKAPDDDTIIANWNSPTLETFISGICSDATEAEQKAVIESYRRLSTEIYPTVPGAKETIEITSQKYCLGLLTSRDREALVRVMKMTNIDTETFEHMSTSDDTPYRKPDGRVFKKILDELSEKGITPVQAIYIGDMIEDYRAATEAGLGFVAVLTGTVNEKQFEKAGLDKEFILPSIAMLPEFLDNYMSG